MILGGCGYRASRAIAMTTRVLATDEVIMKDLL